MDKTLQLTDAGQIKDGDKVLWCITVFNEDNEHDPINLFHFALPEDYPTDDSVKELMAECYADWVDWVDKGGFVADTVYVD